MMNQSGNQMLSSGFRSGLAAVPLRNSGNPVGDKKCPADFGLQIFAVPWTTREVVCADMFNFFTPSLFKGGNPTFFTE
jgi:hypothetical protein